MTEPLHLVRLVLDRRELVRLAPRGRALDEGYLLHAGLARLFATSDDPASSLVQPFAIDDLAAGQARPGQIPLLGYSSLPEGELLARMGPARQGLLCKLVTREVPPIVAGTTCAFRTRVCPVVRTKHPGQLAALPDKKGRPRSREVDAWLAHRFKSWQPEPPRDQAAPVDTWAEREQVYRGWLARELSAERKEASPAIERPPAELQEATMVEFAREPLRRKGAPRQAPPPGQRQAERPDAVLEGTLVVRDEAAFRALLARGVGRHRAFGYGMLLVRPG